MCRTSGWLASSSVLLSSRSTRRVSLCGDVVSVPALFSMRSVDRLQYPHTWERNLPPARWNRNGTKGNVLVPTIIYYYSGDGEHDSNYTKHTAFRSRFCSFVTPCCPHLVPRAFQNFPEGVKKHGKDDFEDVVWTDESGIQLRNLRRFCCRKEGQRPKVKPRYAGKKPTVSRRFVTRSCVCVHTLTAFVLYLQHACRMVPEVSTCVSELSVWVKKQHGKDDFEDVVCTEVIDGLVLPQKRTATKGQVEAVRVSGLSEWVKKKYTEKMQAALQPENLRRFCCRKEGQRPKAKPRRCTLQETYAEKTTTVSCRFVTRSCVCVCVYYLLFTLAV